MNSFKIVAVFALFCMAVAVHANNVQVSLSNYQMNEEQQSTQFCYQVQLDDSQQVLSRFVIRLYKDWNNDNNRLLGLSAPDNCEVRVSFISNALFEFALSAIDDNNNNEQGWSGEFCVEMTGLIPLVEEGQVQVQLANDVEVVKMSVPGPAGNGYDFSYIQQQQQEVVVVGNDMDDEVVIVSASFSKKSNVNNNNNNNNNNIEYEEGMERLATAMNELEIQETLSQLLGQAVYVVELKQSSSGAYSAIVGFLGGRQALESLHIDEFERVGLENVEVSYLESSLLFSRQVRQMAQAEENFQMATSGASRAVEFSFLAVALLFLSCLFM